MGGSNELPVIGFREAGFRHEFMAVLAKGTQDMVLHTKDPQGFVDAYDRMDLSLNKVVDKWDPPPAVLDELKEVQRDAVESLIRTHNVNLAPIFEKQTKKTCAIILNGLKGDRIVRLDTIIDDTTRLLMDNGMTRTEAQRMLADLTAMDCKNLGGVIREVGGAPKYRRFLRFLEDNGTDRIRQAVREEVHSTVSKPSAKLLRMPVPQERKPLRPITRIRQ